MDGNYARLVLDRVHTASGTAPGTLRTLNLDNHVFFGGHIRQQGTRHGRSPQVSNGFRGCMDSIVLNGQELPLNSKPRSYAHMEESVDVTPGCLLTATDGCSSSPCQNGGICSTLPNGGKLLFIPLLCVFKTAFELLCFEGQNNFVHNSWFSRVVEGQLLNRREGCVCLLDSTPFSMK